MKNKGKFILYSAGGWAFFGVFSAWLLGSQVRYYLIHGFVILALLGVLGTFLITWVQCLVVKCTNYPYWFLSTLTGLIIGSSGVVMAYFIAYFPFFNFSVGSPLADWLLWLAYLILLSAVGGAVGGLLAGVFANMAFRQGSLGSWIGISTANWALTGAVVGFLAEIIRHPDYYGLRFLYAAPLAIQAIPIFVIVGLIQAGMLRSRLDSLGLFSPQ